jgi:phosphatidylglycerophosphatase A
MKFLAHPVHFFSLGFGSGLVPRAPGTAGTLVGVLLYLSIGTLHWVYYLSLVVLLFIAGIWICAYTTKALNVADHPAIVWDEIVGYLATMAFAPPGWMWIIAGFISFRVFDIWKPWPIGMIDRQLKGGIGIMMDDVVAAIFSLTLLQIIVYILSRY